ncbi:YciI family protein [Mesorhizobium sp. M4B.F.Ca.ET.215.01.1.1]|uniref:YciI family protein n=1 Tax=unclassified Mesorhizobium TaxID=325217 RepID=UPI000FCAD35F|nr:MULTISPECIES: YciI family protein [unclassified Mesorhizobium]RUW28297.1 YciI family protein [Mesorhizobium sp. M4B.F.Ca.ET.013.02.1.1]RVD38371.1 YciI family protein [Mesorhizobium sp. M4B.F.Ca.ET.019.03.1.1]RWF64528.1 MAG: YciI family protein [Mesorhizobium sp.]RWX67845.1 YciI family protein [Mesorhizobium sp. M4B.F.Ca.ET.089.01.1.1]TGQ10706.1 YciI family protein [Mesorhizobium sp. M4B.F.Ca.ET.215.01.1.1]
MRYVCLVYGEEQSLYALTPEGSAKLDADSLAYDRSLDQQGKLIIAQALQSVKTSKSVRRRHGKRLVTDGPFAETKEQLLGFVMIEAETLDEALEIAGDIPLAELGTIEVRAIYDIPGS